MALPMASRLTATLGARFAARRTALDAIPTQIRPATGVRRKMGLKIILFDRLVLSGDAGESAAPITVIERGGRCAHQPVFGP